MSAMLDQDVASFETHRRALTGLAYRMLGSRAEAEDMVQDALLRWHTADRATIEQPRRYLGTVVMRLCLDRMKSAQARREVYVGQWLPEPVVDEIFDGEGPVVLAHDISVALMLLLERLSPLEPASFLLQDCFGLNFADIALAAVRGEAACWQLAALPRRFPTSREDGRLLAAAFKAAMTSGDTQAFAEILAKDAVLYSDGGGKRAAALNPIRGADRILRFFAGVASKNPALAAITARPATINGLPGFVLRESDGSIDTLAVEHRAGRISPIYLI